ncbi:MAG: type III pantothenate kinase [Sphaerochaetaceae bacterium]
MLLVFDIGNSNIVMAVHDGVRWVASWRIYTDLKKTTDEYLVVVESMLEHAGFHGSDIQSAVVCSVVPNLTRSFQKVVQRLCHIEPTMASHKTAFGLNQASIPAEMGNDMVANAVAAHQKYPLEACVILDFGTALTFTTVSASGDILGAAIVPGLVTAVNSLFLNTAQIPQVELSLPKTVIGRNSEESIRGGIMQGYAGLVKELITRIEEEIKCKVKVIATGGLSTTIAPLIGRIDNLEPLHTLEGLRLMVASQS